MFRDTTKEKEATFGTKRIVYAVYEPFEVIAIDTLVRSTRSNGATAFRSAESDSWKSRSRFVTSPSS